MARSVALLACSFSVLLKLIGEICCHIIAFKTVGTEFFSCFRFRLSEPQPCLIISFHGVRGLHIAFIIHLQRAPGLFL